MTKAQEKAMKKCTCCGEEKGPEGFWKDKSRPDGLFPYCKKCAKEQWRKRNPLSSGFRKTRSVAAKSRIRQEMIVKYGIAVVEAMESVDSFD